jgi:CPA2 family monovalent cation:H+ antiporter-2
LPVVARSSFSRLWQWRWRIEELRRLGADEVIPEEFETSVEIFARVLQRFDVPRNVVFELMRQLRKDMYEMFRERRPSLVPLSRGLEALEGIQVDTLLIREHSPAAGQSLVELELRTATGASVLAVKRGTESYPNPRADFRLAAGDVVVLMGEQAALDRAVALIDPEVRE